VRTVLTDIGAGDIAELMVINKGDCADPHTIALVRSHEPECLVVSARSGAGMSELLEAIDAHLPRPAIEVDVVVPYDRGDLIARAHRDGDVLTEEYGEQGTRLHARVLADLAHELTGANVDAGRG
jgi:GTP-binding protein HflX